MIKKLTALLMISVMLGACGSRGSSEPESALPENGDPAGDIVAESERPEEPPQPPQPEPLKELRFTAEQARQIFEPDAQGVVALSSVRDLAALAALVNEGDEWYRDFVWQLKNDISLSGIDFIPIGGSDEDGNGYRFEAVFDGGGHMLRSLTIRENGFANGTGLFGWVGEHGEVRAVHLIDGNIQGKVSTGGVVGLLSGSLSECSFRGEVSGTVDVGGLFGALSEAGDESATPTVRECASNAIVKGAQSVGGLGGSAAVGGTLSDCYAIGTATIVKDDSFARQGTIGGLLGLNSSDLVQNCFAVVEVYTKVGADFVGSFIGYNAGQGVLSCYYADYLNTWDGVCYQAEPLSETDVTGCAVEDITEQDTFRGWDFHEIWGISAEKNRGLPYLICISGS